ncbi:MULTISPECIES: hypothetical protein [Janthinobacterium]|uniref:hypothetical protein n=1 Tax=Janthinobacterium TaxID=29580 RepID=UPI0008915916|nr:MULTISPECIES: hypothetical protein [Janthinobacterium]MBR7635470.1 hypothetical protein [Janthinobacterium lividum]MDO8034237.1 hypothetical protein [Janthinobacterium sp. SUN128]QKY10086.1 hypothetical protein G8765_21595 [Janthinobacterium lividum]SDG87687.1 hypothetical protein SAMN05428968_1390 [Janthinobacterium sp. YR213]
MLSVVAFRRLVRASAIYDVLMTAAFVTPWTFLLMREHLNALNLALGGAPLPVFEPLHLLISSMMGSVVMVWSVLRMLDPQPRFGRYDAVARYLFSTWMAWALLMTGQPLLWLFLVPELAWGLAQSLPLRRSEGGREGHPRESLLR